MDGDFRCVKWLGEPGLLNQRVCRLTNFSKAVLPEYMYYALDHELMKIHANTSFSTVKHISSKQIRAIEISLPSLEEQRRVVDILNHAASIRRLRGEAQKKAREIIPALFMEMLGDPVANPRGWEIAKLGEVAGFVAGATLPSGQSYDGQEGGSLLLKVAGMNIVGNEIFINKTNEWTNEPVAHSAFAPKGSIVFPKRGAAIATNKKRILRKDCALDPNVMAVVPRADFLTSYFVFSFFNTFDLGDISSGTTIPQLNKKDLAPLPIPFPPLEHQFRFAERMEDCLSLLKLTARATESADALSQSMLSSTITT